MAKFSDVVGQVNITATATLIQAADANRELLSIYNAGTATVYLGAGTAVTTANGYPVAANTEVQWVGIGAVYGIVSGGTVDVRYKAAV